MDESSLSFDKINVEVERCGIGIESKKIEEEVIDIDKAKEKWLVDDFILEQLEEDGYYSISVGQYRRGHFEPVIDDTTKERC